MRKLALRIATVAFVTSCWVATLLADKILADNILAGPPINPLPRAAKSTLVHTWNFDSGTEGWVRESQCDLTVEEGVLRAQSHGEDPYFHCPADLPGDNTIVRLRVRSKSSEPGQIFWTSTEKPNRSEAQRTEFTIEGDGQWHETEARFMAPGRLRDLRIDPAVKPGLVEIDWVQVMHLDLHPLSIVSVEQASNCVRFAIENSTDAPVAFDCSGTSYTAAAKATVTVEQPLPGKQPLESARISVQCDSWEPLERTVWVVNTSAPTEWIEQPLEGFVLRVARDGSLAVIWRGEQPVASLGPLVLVDGQLPALTCDESDSAVRFAGPGVQLTITPRGSEVAVTIRSEQPCEGPVVRAFGELRQGLFAGLEYLSAGEHSSSRLDIETDEHVRYAPDPLKVTLPLMAFVTDRGSIALSWDAMALQPIYATPNFFDGTTDHRMSLQGRDIQAVLRLGNDAIEESIRWAVQRHGLPALPAAPRTQVEQDALCLAALNGPLRNEQGWGHCVQPNWARHPAADIASTYWRLSGQVPPFENFVPGGSHIPNGTIFFVTGKAQIWLDMQQRMARKLIEQQQPDGSYRYTGPYQRGHFEDTANGLCATPAARLLEFAYITGDTQALQAGLRTLDYMRRFDTPRGAQVWEIPLHTPDQLASAYLVWAYTRGYQLTGNAEYLREARRWALSGIPFTYLWGRYPIMAYATPPVYGATNWIAPNWMGLPVQWVGGVYAYGLALLAPHEKTLDWNHLARGILISAQQQQYPDGAYAGLLPDSFNVAAQRRQPADINPCALVSLQRLLDGQPEFLSVAVEGNRRVAAPFPVTITDGKARIQAQKGVSYQVLIDGQTIVDVHSQGTDELELPAAK